MAKHNEVGAAGDTAPTEPRDAGDVLSRLRGIEACHAPGPRNLDTKLDAELTAWRREIEVATEVRVKSDAQSICICSRDRVIYETIRWLLLYLHMRANERASRSVPEIELARLEGPRELECLTFACIRDRFGADAQNRKAPTGEPAGASDAGGGWD